MATASCSDDLSIPELFDALKQRLGGISSNCISNSAGLDFQEIISFQNDASDVLSLVKRLRNRSSPIGRLPEDVLERIIAMRVLERDLLAASHVCRRWRDTLVSSPRLWARLQCADVARTQQYLARSGPVPVSVTADIDSDIQALFALKSVTNRFQSLTLRLRAFDLLQVFCELTTPAPVLERLRVHVMPHFGNGPTFLPSIPATFFGGHTPALKLLYLNGINTKLNFSQFPALTRLTLTTNDQIFDMSELFRLFTSATLLEEVSLEFSGPTTPIPRSQGAVQLQRMRKLSLLKAMGEFPRGLVSLLIMPAVEEVRLDVNLPGEDSRTIRDFLPPYPWNFPHPLKVDSLKLDVFYAHCNIQFSGPSGVISVHASRRGSREQNDRFQSYWLGSLSPIHIADVKDLTLRRYHPEESFDRCPVLKTLRIMDGLRSLVVEWCDNTAVIEALSPTKGENILFPRLESLTFQIIMEPTVIFPDLADMARARSQAGFPLTKVSSDQDATFRRSDVEALQCYVSCVELNIEPDSQSSEPVRPIPHQPLANSKTPWGQTTGCSPMGGQPSSNKGKSPLADLAAMYSRG